MRKNKYNLKDHPKFGQRKEDLDPNQRGLLKITKKYIERKELGETYERYLCELIKNAFPDDEVLWDTIFETGNYVDSLKLYQSLQMDILLICSEGLFCIEAKRLSNDKYISLSGGALSENWTLKTTRGTIVKENNGLKQNYGHISFMQESSVLFIRLLR